MAKKKQTKQPHQNMSFQQLVGKANQEALKPYIVDLTTQMVSDLGNQIAARVFTKLGNIQTRIMAMEKVLMNKLGLTEGEIAELVMNVEDEATGHTKVDRGAQVGDLLRLTLWTKNADETEFTREAKREVNSLNPEKPALSKEVDAALVGMKAGESKEIPALEGKLMVKVSIDRVSAPPAKEEAAPSQAEG